MRMAVGVERKLAVLLTRSETEQAVELLVLGRIRHAEIELIQRMHTELAGEARHRLGHGANLSNGRSPRLRRKYSKRPAQTRLANAQQLLVRLTCLLQMLHHPGAKRSLLLRRPLA